MGIMDLLSQANPQQPYQPPVVPASDPTTFALEQFTKGKATPEQRQMVGKLPANVVSDAVSKRDAQAIKDAFLPASAAQPQTSSSTYSVPSAEPVNYFKSEGDKALTNALKSIPNFVPTQTKPAPDTVVSSTPVTIPQISTPMVTNKAPVAPPMSSTVPPTVVSGAIVRDTATKAGPEAANAVAQTMDKPVTKEQAVAATDAVDKFLKDNPDGGTLANILDIVGVALSAYGGTQRETMLQQKNKARMALSQQQALAEQGYRQQEKMAGIGQTNAIELKGMDQLQQLKVQQKQLENELLLKQKDYELAVAKGDTSQIALKNDLTRIAAQRDANLENQKSLILFQTRMGAGANVADKAAQNLLGTP